MAEIRFFQLSPGWRWLVETMSELNFGAIENLCFRAGEPTVDPRPIVTREFLFSESVHSNERRAHLKDFILRKQVVQFISTLGELGTGTVNRLDVRHGLPHRIRVQEVQSAGRRQ